jgi:hypothetical protein
MTAVEYNPSHNKYFEKSKELDAIKEIDIAVEEYNKDPNNPYFLKLLKGVRKAWF